jgi:hypothetical protein
MNTAAIDKVQDDFDDLWQAKKITSAGITLAINSIFHSCPIYNKFVRLVKVKGKAILVSGCGGCETSRILQFIDNRLTDGDEVVSLTSRPAALYPLEDSWYSFV